MNERDYSDRTQPVTALRGLIPAGDGCDTKAEHPAMPIFREYCQVKAEFDSVCRSLAENQQHKASAEKRLCELSAKIQAMVEDGQYDPTVPRAACDPSPNPPAYNGKSRY